MQKLIDSIYFHQTDGVMRLFQYLRKFHPQYPAHKVNDEVVAQHCFPQSRNGVKKVKNFKVDLMKLIEQFLILEQLHQDPFLPKLFLARAYQALALPKLAQSANQKAKQVLDQSPIQDLDYYYYQMQLGHQQYFDPDTPKLFNNASLLQQLLDRLDRFYLLAKYKYVLEALERIEKQQEQFELPLWPEVQHLAQQINRTQQIGPLYLYEQFRQLAHATPIDEEAFVALRNDYFQQLPLLNSEDQQVLFKYLINYTIRAMNKGALQFEHLQFNLYQRGLEAQVVTQNQRITVPSFINIVIIAAKCGAGDWLQQFISQYEPYLNQEARADTLVIAQALVCFHQGDHPKVLRTLAAIQFKIPSLELVGRVLEVKSMFEIYLRDDSYYSIIDSRLNSLVKRYTHKYNFAKGKKRAYQNYVQLVRQLVGLLETNTPPLSMLHQIRQRIQTQESLIQKDWLLKMCQQIEEQNFPA
ncbi:MAG: hypothetical protein AAGD05_08185 [Bacteroidota bacterium]